MGECGARFFGDLGDFGERGLSRPASFLAEGGGVLGLAALEEGAGGEVSGGVGNGAALAGFADFAGFMTLSPSSSEDDDDDEEDEGEEEAYCWFSFERAGVSAFFDPSFFTPFGTPFGRLFGDGLSSSR